jgi:hypothetical protein
MADMVGVLPDTVTVVEAGTLWAVDLLRLVPVAGLRSPAAARLRGVPEAATTRRHPRGATGRVCRLPELQVGATGPVYQLLVETDRR